MSRKNVRGQKNSLIPRRRMWILVDAVHVGTGQALHRVEDIRLELAGTALPAGDKGEGQGDGSPSLYMACFSR